MLLVEAVVMTILTLPPTFTFPFIELSKLTIIRLVHTLPLTPTPPPTTKAPDVEPVEPVVAPIQRLPATPAPPETIKAPVILLVEAVVPVTDAAGVLTIPVNVGDAIGAFNAMEFVTVVENAASLPSAFPNSSNVSNAGPAPPISALISPRTYSVVAICVEPRPPPKAVGAVGVPVNEGLTIEPVTYRLPPK